MRSRFALLAAALVSVALAGCGPSGSGSPNAQARLMLDAAPNAAHAGIYVAETRGFTDSEGVDLSIDAPAADTDPVALLLSNRVQFAVMDLHQLARARDAGKDLVAVMAIVQRPLAAVFAGPSVRRPRDLEGRRVALSPLPAGPRLLDAIVSGDGGDPARVRRTDFGADARKRLLDGDVAATTGLWDVDGVALKKERPGTREFRGDDFGAPAYPELVLVANRNLLQDAPELIQATVTALRRGYREAILGPEEAVGVMTQRVDGLERLPTQAQLDAVLPAFTASGSPFGRFDTAALDTWAAWEKRVGIVKKTPDVTRMFAPKYAASGVISG